MSGQDSLPVRSPPSGAEVSRSGTARKSQRVLACILCQQRKVKCDRKFPCANCVKASTQCIPAALTPRQRRRRFPERELLDRLRHYESLLRQNNIEFNPLHSTGPTKTSQTADWTEHGSPQDHSHGSPDGTISSQTDQTGKSEKDYHAKSLWLAMSQMSADDAGENDDDDDDDDSDFGIEDAREDIFRKAWDEMQDSSNHLLFGLRKRNVDLSTLHPNQVQIFRLWQIYLDNVNPLLKVTHTPTLQARILNAASDPASMTPELEALMFSIYCMAVHSLKDDECKTLLKLPRQDLLTSYQFGVQEALQNAGFMRSGHLECLTALFLYLITVREEADPRSLSCLMAVAVRIARRMGIDKEAVNAKCMPLEAEMRRRLWWAIAIFDTRISEMSDHKNATLNPTWDCRTPLNVNDFDLQPEMRVPPTVRDVSTETIFVVVRSELADFVRHSSFHLDFTTPVLKAIAKEMHHGPVPPGGVMAIPDKVVEEKYLKHCNPENPVHFATIWMARGYIAKNRLVEYYSMFSAPDAHLTDTERDRALSYALTMLECDTILLTTPLVRGFIWFANHVFPFPAYFFISQDLKRRPLHQQSDRVWEVVSDNYRLRMMGRDQTYNPFYKILAKFILQAWGAREAAFGNMGTTVTPPLVVSDMRNKLAAMTPDTSSSTPDQTLDMMGFSNDDFAMPMSTEIGAQDQMQNVGTADTIDLMSTNFSAISDQTGMNFDMSPPMNPPMNPPMSHIEWTAMYWNRMRGHGW